MIHKYFLSYELSFYQWHPLKHVANFKAKLRKFHGFALRSV